MSGDVTLILLLVAIGPVLWAVGRVVEAAVELFAALGAGLAGWDDVED